MNETAGIADRSGLGAAQTRAIGNMALFGAFWALYLAISKFLPGGYSIFEVLWGRYALHVLLTLLVIGPFRVTSVVKTTLLRVQLLRGILMLLTSVGAVWAAAAMSLDEVRAILWVAPFAVIGFHRLMRGTAVPRSMWIACAIGWAGTFAILRPSLSGDLRSLLWAVIAAVTFGGYQLLTAELRSDAATTSVFYSGLVTLVVMSAVMPWVWKPITGQAAIVYLGMGVAGWLSLLFLDRALHTLEPGRVVVYGYIHLVASVVIGSVIGGRGPGGSAILGRCSSWRDPLSR